MLFEREKTNTLIIGLTLLSIFLGGIFLTMTVRAEEGDSDKVLYDKYEKYRKYDKREKYRKYKKYKKKYGFGSSSERRSYRQAYKNYKKYKKSRRKYSQYANLKKKYKRYKKYRKYVRPYRKYKKYKKYNKKKYSKREYRNYGGDKYKAGWLRFKYAPAVVVSNPAKKAVVKAVKTEADLGGGNLGPEITVGLFRFSKDDLKGSAVRIKANKDYLIKDMEGKVLGTIKADTETRIKYEKSGQLAVNGSIDKVVIDREVRFEAVNADEKEQIFEVVSPGIICYSDNCNTYRGKLKLRYSPESKKIWLINTLPLEQYVWGMGEITGTGDGEYNKVMTSSYRTYGYWKIKYSTKYASEGFKVNATPGNQLYFGYHWEDKHSNIKKAAFETRGKIVMYGKDIAIVPYSSWTDGRTRSWEERWGSKNYPWCQSVKDKYGKHPSKKTKQLEAEGNHMVGLSAHGALYLAGKKDWGYEKILKYYLKDIRLYQAY